MENKSKRQELEVDDPRSQVVSFKQPKPGLAQEYGGRSERKVRRGKTKKR